MGFILFFIFALAIFIAIAENVEYGLYQIKPFFDSIINLFYWIWDKRFLCGAIACFSAAWWFYFVFKPHQAAKYFEAYKKGLIERKEAVVRITNTLYVPFIHGLPAAWKSRLMAFRIKQLNIRIRAEEAFMQDLIHYIRAHEAIKFLKGNQSDG